MTVMLAAGTVMTIKHVAAAPWALTPMTVTAVTATSVIGQ